MIGEDDARRTRDMGTHYVLQPQQPWWDDGLLTVGQPVPEGFSYRSDNNPDRLGVVQVRELLGSLGLN
jgi:UDP-N-acetylglucosamine 4,6-dehydratase